MFRIRRTASKKGRQGDQEIREKETEEDSTGANFPRKELCGRVGVARRELTEGGERTSYIFQDRNGGLNDLNPMENRWRGEIFHGCDLSQEEKRREFKGRGTMLGR